MPHFNFELTPTFFITVIGGIWAWIKASHKIDTILVRQGIVIDQQRALLDKLAAQFDAHEHEDDRRFERFEERILDLVAGLQRVIGQSEIFRRTPRTRDGT